MGTALRRVPGKMIFMADNVLQTLQRLVQDVIAPDVRELKVRMAAFEKSMDERFTSFEKSVDERFTSVNERFTSLERSVSERFTSLEKSVNERSTSLERQSEAQFKAIMAAFGESRAQTELFTARAVAAVSERVTVLEARRH